MSATTNNTRLEGTEKDPSPMHGASRWIVAVGALILFGGLFFLFTLGNDFPYYYHPDEPGKVTQVLSKTRNFNHPLFLLSVSQAVCSLKGGLDEQTVVEVGRGVSAAMAALGILCLSFIAYALRGVWAAIAVVVVMGLSSEVFKAAHYMKEDASLLGGIGLTLLAIHFLSQNVSRSRFVALGAATAVALSSKYVGYVVLIVVVPMVIVRANRTTPRGFFADLLSFLVPLAVMWSIFNYSLFSGFDGALKSLARETEGVATGQGAARSVPHGLYFSFLPRMTSYVCIAMVCVSIIAAMVRRARPVEMCGVVLMVGYLGALSFSPLAAERYALPHVALVLFLGVLGAFTFCEWLRSFAKGPTQLGIIGGVALCVASVALHWKEFQGTRKSFATDDRVALIEWVVQNVPKDAVLAQDSGVRLPTELKWKHPKKELLAQKVLSNHYAADLGTIEQLQEKGVRYVVVSSALYTKFLSPDLKAKKGGEADFERRKLFYKTLFQHELVWERRPGKILYLQPGLRLYRLR